jgi:hypothetical protein
MGKESMEYEIRQPGQKAKGIITQIKTQKASEIYKAAAKNPDQLLLVVSAKTDGWTGRVATFNKPASKLISPSAKLAKFIQKYKRPPETGMPIDLQADSKGFWTIVM